MFYYSARFSYDYDAVDTVLEFPEGSEDGARMCINVTIHDDLLVEGNETFSVKLAIESGNGGVSLGNNHSVITILDANGQCSSIIVLLNDKACLLQMDLFQFKSLLAWVKRMVQWKCVLILCC